VSQGDDDILLAVSKRRLGHALGSFQLESIVGVGAVTVVYAGLRADGARGAVRVMHPEIAGIEGAAEAFLASAQVANRVGHAGAVRVLEQGDDPARPFVVTPLLEGQSLAERAARSGRMRQVDVVRIADAALETLSHAHKREIVHGDVQPHNLRITPRGLRLLDFGVARLRRLVAAEGLPSHRAEGTSSAWLVEEPGVALDLAAVAAAMAALLTGVPMPDPEAEVELGPDVDPALADFVRLAMARGFGSAAAMRAELATWASRALSSLPPATPSLVPAPPSSGAPAPPVAAPSVPPPAPQLFTPALRPVIAPPPPPAPSTPPPPPPRAPAHSSLEFDLESETAAVVAASIPPPARTAPPPPRASAPPPPLPSRPPPRVPSKAPPAPARGGQVDPTGREAAAARSFFAAVSRCLNGGVHGIVEALAYEAMPVLGGEEAARDAARPEPAKLLVRAHEAACAAIAAGEGQALWPLGPRGFEMAGQPVWQAHGPLGRVPACLLANGVRALGLRRGLMLAETGELLRLFAAVVEGQPALSEDLAGALWEAALPHVLVDAEEDPLGPLEGDPAEDLAADRARELSRLHYVDAASLTLHHGRAAGRGAPFAPLHEELIEALTRLPADVERRTEAHAIFGGARAEEIAVPREEALHVEEETRRIMKADLEGDPLLALERHALAAARAAQAGGAPVAAALRASVDELCRGGEPCAALGLVHAACAAVSDAPADGAAAEPTFELALDDHDGSVEDEASRALARAVVSPEALSRIVVAPPKMRVVRHGPTPAAMMAARVRALLGRLGDGCAPVILDAFPRCHEPLVREELGRCLARSADAVVAPIAALLPQVEVDPAIALVRVLARIGTRPALEAITGATKSPHALVRIEALSHVEGVSSERLRVEMNALLADPEPQVRLAALGAILQSHIKVAGPHLAMHAQGDAFDERPLAERRAMLRTLALLLPSRAEDICLQHVQKSPLIPRAAHEETRELAAEMLGEIGASRDTERALVEVAERRWRNTERTRAAARAAAEKVSARLRAGAHASGGAPK
jgi:serine/threonine protein kinase